MEPSAAIDEATADLLLTNPPATDDGDLAAVAGFLAELRTAGRATPAPPNAPVAAILDSGVHARPRKR